MKANRDNTLPIPLVMEQEGTGYSWNDTPKKDEGDDWGFDPPRCGWNLMGEEVECGEGVICPKCNWNG